MTMYRNELNKAKAQVKYYGELQRAFERRQNRMTLHRWVHQKRKYLEFFGGLFLFVFAAIFVSCGILWAEGVATATSNTLLIISMVLTISTAAGLLWVNKN